MAVSDNIHYVAIKSFHSELVQELQKGDVTLLVKRLYVAKIISSLEYEVLQDKQHDICAQVRRLVIVLVRKTQASPSNYTGFVAVLRGKKLSSAYAKLVAALEDNLVLTSEKLDAEANLKRAVRAVVQDNETQDLKVFKKKNTYIRFHCCGICNTSIKEFMEGKDCPNLYGKSSLLLHMWSPDLNKANTKELTPGLADMEYSSYKEASKRLAEDLQSLYSELIDKIILTFRKHSLDMHLLFWDLEQCCYRQAGFEVDDDFMKLIQRAQYSSFEELHELLKHYICSWFNINPIASIPQFANIGFMVSFFNLVLDRDQTLVITSYEQKLANFLRRCCFERDTFDGDILCREIVCRVLSPTDFLEASRIYAFKEKLKECFNAIPEILKTRIDTTDDSLILIHNVLPSETKKQFRVASMSTSDNQAVLWHSTVKSASLLSLHTDMNPSFSTNDYEHQEFRSPADTKKLDSGNRAHDQYQWISNISPMLRCRLCACVAINPHRDLECRAIFCERCATMLLSDNSRCPACNTRRFTAYPELRIARHIKALKVGCNNLKSGCKWVGELEELETHLQTCDYALLPCTNECKDRDQITQIYRRDFQEHLTNQCPRRQYQCPHCEEMGEFQERMTSHLEACPKVKVPCPNDPCQLNIPRYELPIHQSTCDFEPVSCKYAEVGCEERPLRKNLKKHEENSQHHGHPLLMTTQAINEQFSKTATCTDFKKKNEQPLDSLEPPAQAGYSIIPTDFKDENNPLKLLYTYTPAVCEPDVKSLPDFNTKSIRITAPFCFRLTNYQTYKDENQVFHSLPFYTSSRNGYRMCLEVYPNGNDDYRNNYVSVFACLMKGDNDNFLSWPFTGKVTFELLNQLEDKNHHKRTARFGNIEIISKRVMNDEFGEGGGIPDFKFHPELDYQPDKNCQYLKDDTLIFRVSVQVPDQEPNFERYNKFSAGPIKVCQMLKFSAKLPFINSVEVLQVSSKGGQYRDDSLGLCIDVPEGAVPEGSLLQLEIGMCLYGPFKFPGGLNPIAPILMLCPQNDIELRESVRVTLPHIIEDADNSNIETLGVQVIKADHDGLLTADECIFNTIIGDSDLRFHTHNENGLVTFSLPHFCFVTLRASSTSEVAERMGYCVCPLLPPPKAVASGMFTYYLCVTYFMDPCLEAIKDQFSQKGFELYTSNIKRLNFKGKKKCVQAKLHETQCGWIASLSSADEKGIQVIHADSVDLWCKEENELKLEIKNLMYPPSFQVTAIGQQATAPSFVTIQFMLDGAPDDNFFMRLPLSKESLSLKGRSHTPNPHSKLDAFCSRFGLKDDNLNQEVTNEHILENYQQINHWKRLAAHLGLTRADIQAIEAGDKPDEKLMRLHTLQEWQSKGKIHGTSTFRVLIKAMLDSDCSESAEQVCIQLANVQ